MISRVHFLAASTPSLCFSNVCCHSSADCISTTVTIDRTPPRLGRLLVLQHDEDAELDDPKTSSYQYSKIVMRLALRNFTDPESGILAFTAAVYRTDGWLIQPETSLGARDFVTFAVPFDDGRSYYASVTVYNRAELTAVINSSVVTVDATPPVIAYVRDAIGSGFPHLRGANGEDAEAVARSALEVGCLFHAYDLQSGLREVNWCLGSVPGMCDFLPTQPVAHAVMREMQQSLGGLIDGVRYYSLITATNHAGSTSSAMSDGFVVDVSAPTCGQILDGAGFDRDHISPMSARASVYADDDGSVRYVSEMPIVWSRFADDATGISGYAANVIPSSLVNGAVGDMALVDVGMANSLVTLTSLRHGVTYHGVVRATDQLGNARICYSDGVTLDATPPNTTLTRIKSLLAYDAEGSGGEGGSSGEPNRTNVPIQSQPSLIHLQASGFADPESGIRQYLAAAGTATDSELYSAFRPTGATAGEILLGGIALPDGKAVVTIRAVNGAGESIDVPFAIGVDTRRPRCSGVGLNGSPPGKLVFTENLNRIVADWSCADVAPWEDAPLNCEWAVGTMVGGDDLMSWTPAAANGSHAYECAECLANGIIYFASVRCTDHAGWSVLSSSSGLMPDIAPPTVEQELALVSSTSGRSVRYWGDADKIALVWSFADAESGIMSVRADVSDSAEPRAGGIEALPIELPGSRARGRRMLISLDSSGLVLRHNRYYHLHACAVDFQNHTVCAETYRFLVDLTPPVCTPPVDLIDGLPAPAYFSRRLGYSARWRCADPESGVMHSDFMAYADGAQLLTRILRQRGGDGVKTLMIPYADGTRFTSSVAATNGAELSTSLMDSGSNGTTFDGSAAVMLGNIVDGNGGRFQRTTQRLCTLIPPLEDPTSDLKELSLETLQQIGEEEVPHVDPLVLFAPQARSPTVICRNVSLEHGARYLSRVRVTHHALPPLVSQERSAGFLVDETPPFGGAVGIRLRFPRGFYRQAGFPASVQRLVVRVRMSSFEDGESGIAAYRVVLYANGTQIESSNFTRQRGSVAAVDVFKTGALGVLRNGTMLAAIVTPINGVGMEGPSVSVEKLLLLSDIELDDPWFTGPLGAPIGGNAPLVDDVIGVGFKLASDPMRPGSKFEYTWAVATAPCEDEERARVVSPTVAVEAGLLATTGRSAMTNDMLLPAPGSHHKARDAVWSKRFEPARLPPGEYCVLVTACTGAVLAPDGSVDMEPRCKNATSSIATIDTSPPVAVCNDMTPLNASSTADDAAMRIPFSCTDEQSSLMSAQLDFGVVDDPRRELSLALNWTLDANANDTLANETTIDHSGTWRKAAPYQTPTVYFTEVNATTVSGYAVVSASIFSNQSRGDDATVQLTCVNELSFVGTALLRPTLDFRPPRQPMVSFGHTVGAIWSADQDTWFAAASLASNMILNLHASDVDGAIAAYRICISRDTISQCDAYRLTVDANATSLVLPALPLLPNASSTTFMTSVEAVDTIGRTSQSEVSLLLDSSPPDIGGVQADIFVSGGGTDSSDADANATIVVDDAVVRLELLGGAEDTDLNDFVSVQWEAYAYGNASQLPPPECSYLQLKEDGEWVWTAHCRVTESMHLCFSARAVSAIGLVSSPSPAACVVMRLRAATWPSAPSLTTTTLGHLNVSWSMPIDLPGAPSTILYEVCTHAGCADSISALPRQRSALIDLDAPLLVGYEGEVWVVLHASPSFNGAWVGSVIESTRVVIGGSGPGEGALRLLPQRVADLSEAVVYVDGFNDALRGINSFTWCIGTEAGKDDLLACRTEAGVPNQLVLASLSPSATFNRTNANGTSQSAVVTARACNPLGQCIGARSNELSIDGVPPDVSLGYAFDGLAVGSASVWEEVLILSCPSVTTAAADGGEHVPPSCSLAPLLDGSEDDTVREALVSPLRLLVMPTSAQVGALLRRPAAPGSGSPLLAASWGGFSDAHSGVGRVKLCFEPLEQALVPGKICADVEPSGMLVMRYSNGHLHSKWKVTVTVADRAGNNATVTSAGVELFNAAPEPTALDVVPHELAFASSSSTDGSVLPVAPFAADSPLFSPTCTGVQMRWAPFGDADCNATVSYEWVLCDSVHNCTAPILLPLNTTNVSLPGHTIRTGVRYHGELRATGCAGAFNRTLAISRGFVCDESDPSVVGTPLLTTVNGDALRVNASSDVLVSWASVFEEQQSLAPARVEVCIVYGGSASCPVGGWMSAPVNVSSMQLTLGATPAAQSPDISPM